MSRPRKLTKCERDWRALRRYLRQEVAGFTKLYAAAQGSISRYEYRVYRELEFVLLFMDERRKEK